jgi:hypothetical protein
LRDSPVGARSKPADAGSNRPAEEQLALRRRPEPRLQLAAGDAVFLYRSEIKD